MSNSSGFSGFPPKISGADSYPPSRAELKAKIIAIRGEARVQKARESMEGEIIRHNRNGTTDIRTPRGEITVELPPKDRPSEGARIILDVPRGEPPKHVTITRMTGEPSRAETRQSGQTAQQTSRTSTRGEGARITPETGLSINRQTTEDSRPPQTVPPVPPLRGGDFLRLTPLPPYEPVLPLEQSVRALTEAITVRATLAAFQSSQALQQEVLSVTNPLTTALPAQASQQPFVQIQPQPVLTELSGTPLQRPQAVFSNLPVTVTEPPLATLPPTSLTLTTVPAQTLQSLSPLAVLQNAIPAVQTIALAATENVTAPHKSMDQVLDVRINTIFSPSVSLRLPDIITPHSQTGAAGQNTISERVLPSAAANNIETLLTAGNAVASKALVIGRTAQSQPVLSLFMPQIQNWQNFTIPVQPQNLVTGARLDVLPHIVQPQTATASAMSVAAMPPFIPFEFFSGATWPAAEDIMRTMQQTMPQAAQMLAQTTPNAAMPARLPAAALLFIAAMRGGDIAGWLGDKNVDLLKRLGRGDSLNRLSRDMGGLQRASGEPVSQDWRGMALPMAHDGELSKIMLYYRHDKDKSEDGETRRGTRFIFDLNLSKMGAVQIDGLHRPINDKQGRMDLIIRTLKPVGMNMRQAMRALYIQALQQADAIGDISFQNEKDKFVKIDMPKSPVSF